MSRPPIQCDHRVPYGPELSQCFEIWQPRPLGSAAGMVVMIHGGFWRSSFDLTHASHLCAALAKAGIMVANLEYRRTGETGGGWPITFQDVVQGFHAIRHHFDPAPKPVVLGHSAGGHLALRLASETDAIKGVVALAGVSCLDLAWEQNLGNGAVADFLGGTPETIPAVYETADPSKHSCEIRRTLLHGRADDTVPLAISEAFVERRVSDRGTVTLRELPDADHFDLIDPESPAWASVLSAVRSF